MRFIVALLIASLLVDKADSELSFLPRITCIHALQLLRLLLYFTISGLILGLKHEEKKESDATDLRVFLERAIMKKK